MTFVDMRFPGTALRTISIFVWLPFVRSKSLDLSGSRVLVVLFVCIHLNGIIFRNVVHLVIGVYSHKAGTK